MAAIQHKEDILGGYYDCIKRFHPKSTNWPYRVIASPGLQVKAPDWHREKVTDAELMAAHQAAESNKLTGRYTLEVSRNGTEVRLWDSDPWRPAVVITFKRQ